MLQKLNRLLEELEQATSLDDLQRLITDMRDLYEVSHIVYHWVSSEGEQYGCGTYSREWARIYVERDYLRIDPVVLGCFQRFHPVDWKRLDWSSKAARTFQKEALEHGVGNQGYSIPIRGPNGQFALFTVSHDCSDAEWEAFAGKYRRDLILIANMFNQKGLELGHGRVPEASKSLSPREVDALTFLAMGYSRAQVADTLSISEHTLRAYIESARFKLNALNTTHAVARAMSQGLIVIGATAPNAAGGWPGRLPERQVS